MNKFKILFYSLWLCIAFAGVSCSSEETNVPGTPQKMHIKLAFKTDNDSRSELDNPVMDFKDVKRVWLYIFDSSKCIDVQDINWDPETPLKEYHLTFTVVPGGTYTFMAVGVDDVANETYGQFGVNNVNTPEDLKAKLASGKGKNDMRTAQVFAGNVRKTIPSDADSESVISVDISLRRKVSGILAYLGNIPSVIGEYEITGMKLKLGQKQNTVFPLYKDNSDNTERFGSEPLKDDDKELISWDLKNVDKKDGIFIFPGTDKQLPNTLLSGFFLLPIQSDASVSTMSIELWGQLQGTDAPPTCVKTFEVKYKGNTNFSISENKLYAIGSKGADLSEDVPANLSGNYIEIKETGWEPFTVNVDNIFGTVTGPAIIDCLYNQTNYIFDASSRNDIDMEILPGHIDTKSKAASTPSWTLSVVYDDIDAEHPAGNKFYTNEPKDSEHRLRDWIHFALLNKEGNITEYVNSVTSENGNGMKIKMFINKYSVLHDEIQGKPMFIDDAKQAYSLDMVKEIAPNDYRTAYLKLETKGTKPFYYKIRQYNTLPIYVYDNSLQLHTIGVSRLDYGQKFDENTGMPVHDQTLEETMIWGFTKTYNWVVYGEDHMDSHLGYNNSETVFKRAQDGKHNVGDAYWGSALQKTRKVCTDLMTDNTGKIVKETKDFSNGYLPAYYELNSWMNTIAKADLFNNTDCPTLNDVTRLFNTEGGRVYWSSTGVLPVGTWGKYLTYCFSVPVEGTKLIEDKAIFRDERHHARIVYKIFGFPKENIKN